MVKQREGKKIMEVYGEKNPEITFLKYSFNFFPQFQTDFHHLLSPIYSLCRSNSL